MTIYRSTHRNRNKNSTIPYLRKYRSRVSFVTFCCIQAGSQDHTLHSTEDISAQKSTEEEIQNLLACYNIIYNTVLNPEKSTHNIYLQIQTILQQ